MSSNNYGNTFEEQQFIKVSRDLNQFKTQVYLKSQVYNKPEVDALLQGIGGSDGSDNALNVTAIQKPNTGDVTMNNFKITNLKDPTNDQDAVTKKYYTDNLPVVNNQVNEMNVTSDQNKTVIQDPLGTGLMTLMGSTLGTVAGTALSNTFGGLFSTSAQGSMAIGRAVVDNAGQVIAQRPRIEIGKIEDDHIDTVLSELYEYDQQTQQPKPPIEDPLRSELEEELKLEDDGQSIAAFGNAYLQDVTANKLRLIQADPVREYSVPIYEDLPVISLLQTTNTTTPIIGADHNAVTFKAVREYDEKMVQPAIQEIQTLKQQQQNLVTSTEFNLLAQNVQQLASDFAVDIQDLQAQDQLINQKNAEQDMELVNIQTQVDSVQTNLDTNFYPKSETYNRTEIQNLIDQSGGGQIGFTDKIQSNNTNAKILCQDDVPQIKATIIDQNGIENNLFRNFRHQGAWPDTTPIPVEDEFEMLGVDGVIIRSAKQQYMLDNFEKLQVSSFVPTFKVIDEKITIPIESKIMQLESNRVLVEDYESDKLQITEDLNNKVQYDGQLGSIDMKSNITSYQYSFPIFNYNLDPAENAQEHWVMPKKYIDEETKKLNDKINIVDDKLYYNYSTTEENNSYYVKYINPVENLNCLKSDGINSIKIVNYNHNTFADTDVINKKYVTDQITTLTNYIDTQDTSLANNILNNYYSRNQTYSKTEVDNLLNNFTPEQQQIFTDYIDKDQLKLYGSNIYIANDFESLQNIIGFAVNYDIIIINSNITITSQLIISKKLMFVGTSIETKKILLCSVADNSNILVTTGEVIFNNLRFNLNDSGTNANIISFTGTSNSKCYVLNSEFDTSEFAISSSHKSINICSNLFISNQTDSHRFIILPSFTGEVLIQNNQFSGHTATQCIILTNTISPYYQNGILKLINNKSLTTVQRLLMLEVATTGMNLEIYCENNQITCNSGFLIFYQQSALNGIKKITLINNKEILPNGILSKGYVGIDSATSTGNSINYQCLIYHDNKNQINTLRADYTFIDTNNLCAYSTSKFTPTDTLKSILYTPEKTISYSQLEVDNKLSDVNYQLNLLTNTVSNTYNKQQSDALYKPINQKEFELINAFNKLQVLADGQISISQNNTSYLTFNYLEQQTLLAFASDFCLKYLNENVMVYRKIEQDFLFNKIMRYGITLSNLSDDQIPNMKYIKDYFTSNVVNDRIQSSTGWTQLIVSDLNSSLLFNANNQQPFIIELKEENAQQISKYGCKSLRSEQLYNTQHKFTDNTNTTVLELSEQKVKFNDYPINNGTLKSTYQSITDRQLLCKADLENKTSFGGQYNNLYTFNNFLGGTNNYQLGMNLQFQNDAFQFACFDFSNPTSRIRVPYQFRIDANDFILMDQVNNQKWFEILPGRLSKIYVPLSYDSQQTVDNLLSDFDLINKGYVDKKSQFNSQDGLTYITVDTRKIYNSWNGQQFLNLELQDDNKTTIIESKIQDGIMQFKTPSQDFSFIGKIKQTYSVQSTDVSTCLTDKLYVDNQINTLKSELYDNIKNSDSSTFKRKLIITESGNQEFYDTTNQTPELLYSIYNTQDTINIYTPNRKINFDSQPQISATGIGYSTLSDYTLTTKKNVQDMINNTSFNATQLISPDQTIKVEVLNDQGLSISDNNQAKMYIEDPNEDGKYQIYSPTESVSNLSQLMPYAMIPKNIFNKYIPQTCMIKWTNNTADSFPMQTGATLTFTQSTTNPIFTTTYTVTNLNSGTGGYDGHCLLNLVNPQNTRTEYRYTVDLMFDEADSNVANIQNRAQCIGNVSIVSLSQIRVCLHDIFNEIQTGPIYCYITRTLNNW